LKITSYTVAERPLRYDFASSEITPDAQIQVKIVQYLIFVIIIIIVYPQPNVLDEATESNPGALWWLKADGCNINKGLKETTRLQWSGDVDLGDGALQFESYKLRLQKVNKFRKCSRGLKRSVELCK